MRKLVPHITDSDIFKTFSKQKGIPLKTTLKKAFTWLHRTFHKIWETKKAHFWARLDDAVFDSWSEWKGQKGWKAQCEHPSLHWKREPGAVFTWIVVFYSSSSEKICRIIWKPNSNSYLPHYSQGPGKTCFFLPNNIGFLSFPEYCILSLNTMRSLMVTYAR